MTIGLLCFVFFATLLCLRGAHAAMARLVSGLIIMGIGIWLILVSVTGEHFAMFWPVTIYMPSLVSLLLGLWLVVKGALRFASY